MTLDQLIRCWMAGGPPAIRVEHRRAGIAVNGASLWCAHHCIAVRLAGLAGAPPAFAVLPGCPAEYVERIGRDAPGCPIYHAPAGASVILLEAAKRRLPGETMARRESRPFARLYDYEAEARRRLPADCQSLLRAAVLATA